MVSRGDLKFLEEIALFGVPFRVARPIHFISAHIMFGHWMSQTMSASVPGGQPTGNQTLWGRFCHIPISIIYIYIEITGRFESPGADHWKPAAAGAGASMRLVCVHRLGASDAERERPASGRDSTRERRESGRENERKEQKKKGRSDTKKETEREREGEREERVETQRGMEVSTACRTLLTLVCGVWSIYFFLLAAQRLRVCCLPPVF